MLRSLKFDQRITPDNTASNADAFFTPPIVQRFLHIAQPSPKLWAFAVLPTVPMAKSIWGMCSKHCNSSEHELPGLHKTCGTLLLRIADSAARRGHVRDESDVGSSMPLKTNQANSSQTVPGHQETHDITISYPIPSPMATPCSQPESICVSLSNVEMGMIRI